MSDKYRLLLHTQCIQDFNRILSESLYGLGLRREIREPARDGVVGYAAEIVRGGCEGGGDGAVEGMGGTEAVVEDDGGAGRGVGG